MLHRWGSPLPVLTWTVYLALAVLPVCGLICLSALWIGQRAHNPQLLYSGFRNTLYLTDLDRQRTFALLDPLSTIPLAFGWLPDGSALTYTLIDPQTGSYSLYLFRPATRQITTLLTDQRANPAPSWSPDGKMFAFVSSNDHLCLFTLVTLTHRCLQIPRVRQVVWSPDGEHLAYITGGVTDGGLYLTDPAGTVHTLLVAQPPVAAPDQTLVLTSWSPDGQRLAYLIDFKGSTNITSMRELYIVDLQTDVSQPLITGKRGGFIFGVVWSPEGTRLAYHANRDDQTDIYVLSLADLTEQRITDETADEGGVQWSSDGTRLAYVSNRADASNPYKYPTVYWQALAVMPDDLPQPHPVARTVSFGVAWRPGP